MPDVLLSRFHRSTAVTAAAWPAVALAALGAVLVAGVAPACAQGVRKGAMKRDFYSDAPPEQSSSTAPRKLGGVGLDEHIGKKVPADVPFKNAQGRTVRLGKYLGQGKPVLLTLVYHNCPMLCPMTLRNLTSTLGQMEWTPGEEFEVVSLSFNPREGAVLARKKKKQYLRQLGRPQAAAGWHFLTGTKAHIHEVTDAVGFHFRWLPEQQEYAHPATLIFLQSDGTITRYLNGKALDVPPASVRKALVETSNGTLGTALDQVLLYCFEYNPNANSYVASMWSISKIVATFILLLLGGLLAYLWHLEKKQRPQRSLEQ